MVGWLVPLRGRHDFGGLRERGPWPVEWKRTAGSECLAGISFLVALHLDGRSEDPVQTQSCVHVVERTTEPILAPMGISINDTKLDPSYREALTLGIEKALRRLHVNLGHPTNDGLTRCLAAAGGTRVAHRAVNVPHARG